MTASPRRTDRERGVAAIELLLLTPLLITVVLAAIQVVYVVVATKAAQDAALAAARASSLGRDGAAAANDVVPAGMRPAQASRTGSDERWTVAVDVPALLPWVHVSVERTAELP